MIKRQFAGIVLGAGVAFWASLAIADPAPQYSAEDVAKTFADKPDSSAKPAGECEKKGMVTGDDGVCEPVKVERGFSLPTRASQAATSGVAKTGTSGARLATASSAPVAPHHHVVRSRDLLITFKLGSSDLTDQGRANAKVFAQALLLPDLAGTRFELDGYTDASGDKDKNLALSAQRAAAVKAYLISLGVDATRLDTHGYGAQDFVSEAHPNAPENRRVVATKLE